MASRLQLLPLRSPPRFTKASPCKLSPSSTHVSTIAATRTNQLHAGRGFGVSVSDEKPSPKQDKSSSSNSSEVDPKDEIPQIVFDRMIRRVLICVGAPMTSSIGLVYIQSYLKDNGILDVPVWVAFLSVLLGFGTSALGIAYGTISSSWDPDREGSMFGWEEAQKNWPELWREDGNDKS